MLASDKVILGGVCLYGQESNSLKENDNVVGFRDAVDNFCLHLDRKKNGFRFYQVI